MCLNGDWILNISISKHTNTVYIHVLYSACVYKMASNVHKKLFKNPDYVVGSNILATCLMQVEVQFPLKRSPSAVVISVLFSYSVL